MAKSPEPSPSYWIDTAPQTRHPGLAGDLAVDVAIVGGGIVGLTTALLLKRAGRRVAVLEARGIGGQVTGRSTAKITAQHSLIYADLIRSFGEDGARLYAAANQTAIERMIAFIAELGIDCALERKAAYAYTTDSEKLDQIRAEVEAARTLGLPASFVDSCPLPFPIAGAVRFDQQAQFHPLRYCQAFARAIEGDGSFVFERTRVQGIEEGEPCRVTAPTGTVTAQDVVIATNLPVINRGQFFAKAFPRAHLVVAAPIAEAKAPDGMFISIDQPTHSIRTTPHDGAGMGAGRMLIVVNGGFKTGHQGDTEAGYDELEQWVRRHFEVGPLAARWFNEDFDSMDGVPYIGRIDSRARHLWVGTGFRAWGITHGTVAGILLTDLIQGRTNPWAEFYDATRIKPLASARRFLSENIGVARHFLTGRLGRDGNLSVKDVQTGQAGVFDTDDGKVAVYRDEDGAVHAVSAICPHLGCTVAWNNGERSWDCPCHGSRFSFDGDILHGPATARLETKDVRQGS